MFFQRVKVQHVSGDQQTGLTMLVQFLRLEQDQAVLRRVHQGTGCVRNLNGRSHVPTRGPDESAEEAGVRRSESIEKISEQEQGTAVWTMAIWFKFWP